MGRTVKKLLLLFFIVTQAHGASVNINPAEVGSPDSWNHTGGSTKIGVLTDGSVSTYVGSSTDGDKQRLRFIETSSVVCVDLVDSVKINFDCANTEGGSSTIRANLAYHGSVTNGTTRTTTLTVTSYSQVFIYRPGGGLWTPAMLQWLEVELEAVNINEGLTEEAYVTEVSVTVYYTADGTTNQTTMAMESVGGFDQATASSGTDKMILVRDNSTTTYFSETTVGQKQAFNLTDPELCKPDLDDVVDSVVIDAALCGQGGIAADSCLFFLYDGTNTATGSRQRPAAEFEGSCGGTYHFSFVNKPGGTGWTIQDLYALQAGFEFLYGPNGVNVYEMDVWVYFTQVEGGAAGSFELRPDAEGSGGTWGTGNWTAFGGAINDAASVSDGNDATGMLETTVTSGSNDNMFSMQNAPISMTGKIIDSIVGKWRMQETGSNNTSTVVARVANGTAAGANHATTWTDLTLTLTDKVTAPFTTRPQGGAWTAADITALLAIIELTARNAAVTDVRMTEIVFTVYWRDQASNARRRIEILGRNSNGE